jgi:hypothetical protein
MNSKSRELLDQFDRALSEVHRQAASGELDGSGRFYTDEELAAGAATGRSKKPAPKAEDPAA